MGKALIRADRNEVIQAVLRWSEAKAFSVASPEEWEQEYEGWLAGEGRIRARRGWVVGDWLWRVQGEEISIDAGFRPVATVSLLIFAVTCLALMGGSGVVRTLIDFGESGNVVGLVFSTGCILVTVGACIVWLKVRFRLTELERAYWGELGHQFGVRMPPRAQGFVVPQRLELLLYVVAVGSFIFLALPFGAWVAAVWGLTLVTTMYPSVLGSMLGREPAWDWRLLVVSAVHGWTSLAVSIIFVAVILAVLENAFVAAASGRYEVEGVSSLLAVKHFRRPQAGESENLERGGMALVVWLAEEDAKLAGAVLLLSVATYMVIAYGWGVWHFLSKGRAWEVEAGAGAGRTGPRVPPLARAENEGQSVWPILLPYFVVAGMTNWCGLLLSAEAAGYGLLGRSLLWPVSANLWSWPSSFSGVVFGEAAGRYVGRGLALVMAGPVAVLSVVFVGRVVMASRSLVQWLGSQTDEREKGGEKVHKGKLVERLGELCARGGLEVPTLAVRSGGSVGITTGALMLGLGPVTVRTNHATVDLLTPRELRVVVAHELGHIKQGLWRVGVLKGLSTLSFFPNYCLTTLLDWPQLELKADHFALELTGDPESLRSALVKLSVAQLRPRASHGTPRRGLRKWFERFEPVYRFYFGEGLLGMVHPFLSDRLAAIDRFGRATNE